MTAYGDASPSHLRECAGLKCGAGHAGSGSACQNRVTASWVAVRAFSSPVLIRSAPERLGRLVLEISYALGVRPFRSLAEESRFGGSRVVARYGGVGRSGQADAGRGPCGRATCRYRSADPRRHAGDRDFQPALHRERRTLHDGHADVLVRHGKTRAPRL
jgi:hypothetical protein